MSAITCDSLVTTARVSEFLQDIKLVGVFRLEAMEGRKEGTCLFDINTKHNTEIYIGKIISGDSH